VSKQGSDASGDGTPAYDAIVIGAGFSISRCWDVAHGFEQFTFE
jgi:hypothetical protein